MATGKVQLVGYRARVAAEAEKRGLVGSVENDEKDERRVLIDVQGPEPIIEAFRTKIETPEGRSVPRTVLREGKPLPVDEALDEFRVKRGEVHLETLERMEFAGEALTNLYSVTSDLSNKTVAGFSSLSGEMKEGFSSLSGEMKEGFSSLSGEMKEGFSSLSGEMRQGFEVLGGKIDEGVQGTSALHRDIIQRFDEMGKTYGMISKRLGLIEKDLRAQTKATLQQSVALLRLAKTMEQVARIALGASTHSPRTPLRNRRE